MGLFYYKKAKELSSDVDGVSSERLYISKVAITPSAEDTDAVLEAVTDTGEPVTITTGITAPDVVRNLTATAGGTAGDIGAIQVVVVGTNYNDEVITETLPAFTVDTAGSVTGSKAFKTVTSITIPAHAGTGATTEVGLGSKLGLPYKLTRNTVLKAYLDDIIESVAPTIAVDADDIESNTATLSSALDGNTVDLYLMV